MRAENGLSLDLSEVFSAIGKSDVLVLGFLHLMPRVLFDTRTATGKALFRLVPPVRTPEERFAQLRKLRPGLGDPERFVFIQWPLGMESLQESGTWQSIVDHCRASAGESGELDCAAILERLRSLDAKEDRDAVRGDSFRTVWPTRGRR